VSEHDGCSDTEQEDPRPWDKAGAVRRDCKPHRGAWLRLLGWVSVACIALLPLLVIGLPLGVVVWGIARHDLRKMDAGQMDPSGRSETATASGIALGSVIAAITLVMMFGFCLVLPFIVDLIKSLRRH
jgi:hypothetical protein